MNWKPAIEEAAARTVVASPEFIRAVARLLDTNPDELLSERGYINSSVPEAKTDTHPLEGATQWMQAP